MLSGLQPDSLNKRVDERLLTDIISETYMRRMDKLIGDTWDEAFEEYRTMVIEQQLSNSMTQTDVLSQEDSLIDGSISSRYAYLNDDVGCNDDDDDEDGNDSE